MPCNDGMDPGGVTVYVEKGTQTSRLCAVFTVLQRRGMLDEILSQCDWRESGVSKKSTLEWWERHQREDVARRQREAQERERDRMKQAAREKAKKALTREERKLLGIGD